MARKETLKELKSKEREDRKNLIIDAAARVFSNKPFNRVGMREIADEAGIATSSIYTYFPNQEALFLQAIARDSNDLLDELEFIAKSCEGIEGIIENVTNTFIDFISRHDSYFRMMVVFMTHGNLNPESLDQLNTLVRRGLDLFENVIEKSGYSGDKRILSHYFFASLNGILVTFRKLPGRTDEDIIRHMKRVGKVFKELLVKGV